jgi:hypothetical protein
MYVLWLVHHSARFTQSQSCKAEEKLTHGELHGTVDAVRRHSTDVLMLSLISTLIPPLHIIHLDDINK